MGSAKNDRSRAKRKTAAENTVVYRLEIDLLLSFVPPMAEHARPICLTRALELPFPPWDGLILTSEALNGRPDPMGFVLKEVTWDMDRQLFLAKTYEIIHDLPIACIPYDIRDLLERGWRYGSMADKYGTDEDEVAEGVDMATPSDEDAEEFCVFRLSRDGLRQGRRQGVPQLVPLRRPRDAQPPGRPGSLILACPHRWW
jgi:hypothetical protein